MILVNETMAAAPLTGVAVGTSGNWNAGGWYEFNTTTFSWSDLEYTATLPTAFTMKVDMRMSTTSGADSSYFYYGCSSSPQTEGDAVGGYLIERNDFGNSIAIRFNGTSLTSVSYAKDTNFDTLQVDVLAQTFVITYQGVVILSFTDSTPRTLPGTKYGWGARSGGSANTHVVRNLYLSADHVWQNGSYLGVGDGMSRSEIAN